MADPGFSPGGCANSQNCYYFSNFCRKLHENERIWTPRGGVRPWHPPLDPPMVTTSATYLHIVTFPVIVVESTFSLLPLCRHLLPLTTLNRNLSRHSSQNYIFTALSEITVADAGFPRGGGTNSGEGRQHTILPIFLKNYMKLKEFGPRGVSVPRALLRSATWL